MMANEQIKALRLGRGLTQAELAVLVNDEVEKATGRAGGTDAQSISRIERGEITWPNVETRRALHAVFGTRSDIDLGLQATRTTRDAEEVEDTNRRNFLALAGIGLTETTPRRIGRPDVEKLRTRFARLRDLDNYLGGADTFCLYRNELINTERILGRGHFGAPTRKALASLAAEQAQQAGWAAFDAGHTGPALRLFEYSHRTATEAGSGDLAANALVHIAYATCTRRAVDAADAACDIVPPSASPQTRALLESRRAWSHALSGDAREAAHALDRSREALAGADESPAPHWAAWLNATELDIMTGRVWSVLHEPTRAVPALERALAAYPDHWARDKALYLTFLADALADQGDADRATEVTIDAVSLAASVASIRPIAQAREVARRLTRLQVADAARLNETLAAVNPPIRGEL
jgi:transcriptional regulator with XRE-family HTH domain